MPENEAKEFINRMSGNSDSITRAYFDRLVIEQRLIDSDLADMSMHLFNETFSTPIMLGVIGGFSKLGENALLKSAQAAKELNTVLWVSSHVTDEDLRELVTTGAKIGYVCKPYLDQEVFLSKLAAAKEAGVFMLATDIDHAYKNGNYDSQGSAAFGPKSTAQLKEAKEKTGLPFIAKGVLSVSDARKCKEAGLDGVILSHHHNIYSYAIPPVMVLPEVVKAVGDDFTVIVDCGINSGVEAFKAIALGAKGLCVARPYMLPLAKGGAEGVVEFIKKMTADCRELMNRTGTIDIYHSDPSVIHVL